MRRTALFVLTLALGSCALQTDVRLRRMPDSGMEPTIRFQEVVRENFDAVKGRPFARFDLVVVKNPDKPAETTIRRIVGLPGETVQVTCHRTLVGGRPLAEPFIEIEKPGDAKLPQPQANFGPLAIPADTYFVLGDNRAASLDGRLWKQPTVPKQDILAIIER